MNRARIPYGPKAIVPGQGVRLYLVVMINTQKLNLDQFRTECCMQTARFSTRFSVDTTSNRKGRPASFAWVGREDSHRLGHDACCVQRCSNANTTIIEYRVPKRSPMLEILTIEGSSGTCRRQANYVNAELSRSYMKNKYLPFTN